MFKNWKWQLGKSKKPSLPNVVVSLSQNIRVALQYLT